MVSRSVPVRDPEVNAATVTRRLKTVARRERSAVLTDFAAPPARSIATDLRDRGFRQSVIAGLVAYIVSRLCVIAGAAVRSAQLVVDTRQDIADGVATDPEQSAATSIIGVLTSWDGRWYLELARSGYPDNIPANITFDQLEARAAFFPVYPWLIRAVDFVLPGGDTLAALFTNFVLGAVSVVLVGLLARRLFSNAVATRSMTLYALFPGSYVLSFAYAEATFIVLAALCLLFLVEERWLLAGVAAAVGTGTRPNGVALIGACLVAAALAIRRRRDWTSLVAVALAPVGFVGFQLFVDAQAGERGAWFRVQREAWSEGTSFGATAVTSTIGFLTSPLDSPAKALTALSLMSLLIMVFAAWKRHVPLPWIAYSAIVTALMLIPETVTARPRFVLAVFPLFIAVAAWWPQPKPAAVDADADADVSIATTTWYLMLGLCCAGLAVLTGLYGVFGAIP